MATTPRIVRARPLSAYYLLTFAISWGLFLSVGAHDLVTGVPWDTSSWFPLAVMGLLVGPTIASLALTALLSGRPGLRELLGRLGRWRVGLRWYAVALLTAPFVSLAVLFALWPFAGTFQPVIVTDEFSATALLAALGIAFTTLLEELGWTGFVIPRLRLRHGVFATGLIVGVPWGLWHLFQIVWVARSTSDDLSMALYLPLYLGFGVASLTAYRVLMVWVYDRTRSLLVVTLMHASYAASTLQIDLFVPKLTGASLVVHGWVLTAAFSAVVVAVALASRRSLFTGPSGAEPATLPARPRPPLAPHPE